MDDQLNKQRAIDILRRRYAEQHQQVAEIDDRLTQYYEWMLTHASIDPDDPDDLTNYYELLGAVKFLRLLRTYDFNHKKVRQVIKLREGTWRQDRSGLWQHVSGGIKCPSPTGGQVFRWEPFQVMVLASVFGFQTYIDTQLTPADKQVLLPTERVNTDTGRIEDLRRLCTDYTFFAPRKSDKTGLAAFIQLVFFLLEDYNAEIYCAANSSDQSKLLYRRTMQLLRQIDDGSRIRMTETVCDWRPQYKSVRDTSVRPLSAGGKAKDGMYAQLCCADEYGSAAWVNGKADMKMLVDVITSSMGPRREPLTFTTTTAGRIQSGPFIEKLEALHRLLEKEIVFDRDPSEAGLATDRTLCILFEPDQWERQDEVYLLQSKKVRAKVNRMLGVIVQHQFYDDEAAKAQMTGDMGEFISKFLNVYQSSKTVDWVKPERIRELQTDRRIEQCSDDDGWDVYVGMDFSQGNDLHAATYLAVRWHDDGSVEYFADMDAWINEETLRTSSISELYRLWIDKGWLRLSPGEVFQPNLPVKRIRELDNYGINFVGFGYDSHLSKDPINELKTWLQTIGLKPDSLVVPISQTNASFNPAVDRLTYLLKGDNISFTLSANPLWPYEFGCVAIDEDLRMGNKKPIKRNASDACKVDNVQCLCECFLLEEMFDGKAE